MTLVLDACISFRRGLRSLPSGAYLSVHLSAETLIAAFDAMIAISMPSLASLHGCSEVLSTIPPLSCVSSSYKLPKLPIKCSGHRSSRHEKADAQLRRGTQSSQNFPERRSPSPILL